MKLWIVWLCKDYAAETEIVGIFDSEAQAVQCCRTWRHAITEATLNEDLGDATIPIKGLKYPVPRGPEDAEPMKPPLSST